MGYSAVHFMTFAIDGSWAGQGALGASPTSRRPARCDASKSRLRHFAESSRSSTFQMSCTAEYCARLIL
eukprot:9166344-Pyramimonas_sp.AAC.2